MGLLNTKLFVPAPRLALVPRPQLFARLDQAFTHKLTLLSAPPGFGKSTLLSAWIIARQPQVAWVSLDEGDNDPARFWMYVLSALNAAHPGIGESALVLVKDGQLPTSDVLLTDLLNAVAGLNEPILLVLDDYHMIHSQAIHTVLEFLIEHLPPPMHLIMTTRTDPPLPLSLWRGRDQLVELRVSHLRFAFDETAAFLNQVMKLDLGASDISALEMRTEGWIAGLQLAALALQAKPSSRARLEPLLAERTPFQPGMEERADVKSFIASFTGSNRYVISYLVEQVLDRQSESIQEFLLQTSILARMNAALCDAVTLRRDAQARLEYLDANNLFLISLDDAQEWYRYHHLFAEVLQSRLQKIQPARIPELHYRASEWFAEHSLPDEAVRHALAARDFERAARLIEQNIDSFSNRGEFATVNHWMKQLPGAIIRAHPRLMLARVTMLVLAHDLEEAEIYLDEIERTLGAQPPPRASDVQNILNQAMTERVTISLARRDLAHTMELAKRALDALPPDEFRLRGEVTTRLATSYYWADRMEAARETFAEANRLSERAGDLGMALVAQSYKATVLIAQGELEAALGVLRQIIRRAEQRNIPTTGARLAYQDYGDLLYERNQLQEAATFLEQSIEQSERGNYTRLLVWGLVPYARLLQAQGDLPAARASIERAGELVTQYGLSTIYSSMVTECQVQLWIAQGNPSAASAWARSRGLTNDDELNFVQEPQYRAFARVLIAERDYAGALKLLVRLSQQARHAGRKRHEIQADVLQAIAWQAHGNMQRALAALEPALLPAEREGFVRTFVDEGKPMRILISELANSLRRSRLGNRAPNETTTRLLLYAEKLLAAFPHAGSIEKKKIEIPEPLTPRELEILHLIAAGRTNPEIAETLVLAVGTVKKHTNTLFGKLGASNRTQAVVRAREFGLL